jgi:uncharacterized protein YyaL (SSP411 family)
MLIIASIQMNRLSNETSPYLLQHAHNPVDWYAWGNEALQRAIAEDKPILVSIGYSACHWCHVMERESFEDKQVAAFMNENFVNIKIDREERPDIDHIYMDAVVVMTGHGGWPLNCFLLPDGRPFYGGTYFPPQPMEGRADWLSVLKAIAHAFANQRHDLEQQANKLTYHIFTQQQNVLAPSNRASNPPLTNIAADSLNELAEHRANIDQHFQKYFWQTLDRENGGFGTAPKFPGTMALQYLLQYAYHTDHEEATQHAFFSIDAMCNGGIYDHLGGGFARYTVDKKWHVPHFEKMLYDNALLVSLLSEAYKILQYNLQYIGMAGADNEYSEQRKQHYADAIKQTLEWVTRDMTNNEGAFYAAYDADSEGEEGKFYVWQKREIDKLLQDDAPIFCAFYGINEDGNWEHGKNILYRRYAEPELADKIGYDTDELQRLLAQCRRKLFLHREKRPKPLLDDKIVLGWNALMNTAYSKAYTALQKESYRQIAQQNMAFMLKAFYCAENGGLYHNYKNGKATNFALLDDYALLIESLLELYQIDFDTKHLEKAVYYANYTLKHFLSAKGGLFYYTHAAQTDLIGRKIEYYDNATPSGNSTMAQNLLRLAALTGNNAYQKQAEQMIASIETSILRYTGSFGRWAGTLLSTTYPPHEIAVVGKDAFKLAIDINQLFLPATVIMATNQPNEAYPLLKQRYTEKETLIYTCKGYECHLPTANFEDFTKLLSK